MASTRSAGRQAQAPALRKAAPRTVAVWAAIAHPPDAFTCENVPITSELQAIELNGITP